MVSSSSGPSVTIPAKEKTPPKPVSILFCNFIYKEGNGIRLTWQSPGNRSRDIKKYQVFRRKTILEPFKLIAEYDFTDPEYESPPTAYEFPSPDVVQKSDRPVYQHVDKDFQRDSSMIYSICAIDAHGLSSTMGTQLKASFDNFTNKLIVNKISRAGAPKAYPNLFLNKNAGDDVKINIIEDVARDTGHHRMRIYFNPDTYRYLSNGKDEPVVATTKSGGLNGSYKFQIINLDRQKTKVLDVQISPQSNVGEIM